MIAKTHKPPYYAVIFSSLRTENEEGYTETDDLMMKLVSQQEGFLGLESAQSELGITVSYWQDLESIKKWKMNTDHQMAQKRGRKDWYVYYKTRIARVERDYDFKNE